MNKLSTATDLVEALRLAENAFSEAKLDVEEFLLIRAHRLFDGGKYCSGNHCWRLTFKRKRLIPEQISTRIGLGGEVFFTVNLDEGRAILTGHGE